MGEERKEKQPALDIIIQQLQQCNDFAKRSGFSQHIKSSAGALIVVLTRMIIPEDKIEPLIFQLSGMKAIFDDEAVRVLTEIIKDQ